MLWAEMERGLAAEGDQVVGVLGGLKTSARDLPHRYTCILETRTRVDVAVDEGNERGGVFKLRG